MEEITLSLEKKKTFWKT